MQSSMETEAPASPNPSHNDNYNNNTFNYDPNTISSQLDSNNPSAPTSTPPQQQTPAVFGMHDAPTALGSSALTAPYHWLSHSDGSFHIAADDERGLSGELFNVSSKGNLVEMAIDDDFLSAFHDLQRLGRIDDICGAVPTIVQDDGSGGEETEKSGGSRNGRSGSLEGLGDAFEVKKAMRSEKLAEIQAVDPKRAKRILANRQSAARSKERKAQYVLDLERKVQSIRSEATSLSAQLRMYQRDTKGLTTVNAQLKLRLQAMEQQAQLRGALNEALKQEIDRLKKASGETNPLESFSLGGGRMPYNQIPSPSSLQSMQYCSLASPSTMQTVSYSPAASPSTMQTMSYSPAASSPPAALQSRCYNRPVSASPRTTTNIFPLPKRSVPLLAQMPPFHNSSRSSLSSHHLCPANTQTPPVKNNSFGHFQGLDTSDKGLNLVNTKSPPVAIGESGSTTQMLIV